MPSGAVPDATAAGFLAARRAGRVPLSRVFWIDMLVIGTAINVLASLAAVLALGFKAPEWLSLAIYLSPLPWSLFLVLAVWRACDRPGEASPPAYRAAALAWLAAATLI